MVKLPRPLLLLAFGAAMGLFNCAARRPALQAPQIIEKAVDVAASDRDAAIAMLESELSARPDIGSEPWLLLWAGEQRRLSGDTDAARAWFEQLADRYGTHPVSYTHLRAHET